MVVKEKVHIMTPEKSRLLQHLVGRPTTHLIPREGSASKQVDSPVQSGREGEPISRRNTRLKYINNEELE